jgi:hypothetical protein
VNYFDQLKHAARLFWHTKALWFLGMLAALFGQNEYGFSVNYSESAPSSSPGSAASPFGDFSANPMLASFLANPLPYLAAIGAIVLLWWIIATLVGWLVQGTMIDLVDQTDQQLAPSVRASFRHSRAQIWPLFLINLIVSLPTLIVVIIAAALFIPLMLTVFRSATPDFSALVPRIVGTLLCLVPLFLLNALAGVALRLLNILAARACLLEGLSARASLRQGWLLLRRNLGYTVLNWFVLLIVGAGFSFVAAIPALLLLVPAARAFLHNEWTTFAYGAAIGVTVYFIVMSLGVGGILTGFNSTVWTVLYQGFQRRMQAVGNEAGSV